jgi:hypothetical protein
LIEDLSLGDDEDDEEEEGSAAPAGMVEWATMSTYSIAHGASADHRSEMHLFNPYKFCFSSLLLAMNM